MERLVLAMNRTSMPTKPSQLFQAANCASAGGPLPVRKKPTEPSAELWSRHLTANKQVSKNPGWFASVLGRSARRRDLTTAGSRPTAEAKVEDLSEGPWTLLDELTTTVAEDLLLDGFGQTQHVVCSLCQPTQG